MNNDASSILDMFLLKDMSDIDASRDINDMKALYADIHEQLLEGIKVGHAQMHTVAAMVQELNEPMIFERKIYLRAVVYQKYETENPYLLHRWITSGRIDEILNERYGQNIKRSIMVNPFWAEGNMYSEINAIFSELQPELMKHYVALNAVMSELSGRAQMITRIMNELDRQIKLQQTRNLDPLSKSENNLAKKYMSFAINTKHDSDLIRKRRLRTKTSTLKPMHETIAKMRVKI